MIDEATQLRFKRGVFNFIGGISNILFRTMDSEDASYYTDKISELEKEQADFLKLSKEQITVVKSTLISINTTLQDVYENENYQKDCRLWPNMLMNTMVR
jgi:hypothetical protein